MNRILAPLLLLALAASASAAATPDTGFGGTGVVTASLDDTNLTTAVVGCHVHSDDSLFLLIAAPDGMYVRNVEKGSGATRTLVWPSGQIRLAGIDPRHALYLARRASPPTNPSNQFRIVAGKPMLRVGPSVYRFNADGSRDSTYGLDGAIQAWQSLISISESETGKIHLRSDGVVEAAVQRVVFTTGPVATCTHLMRRWDAEGVADATFGAAGQATLALTSSYDFNDIQHMVSASDGTALVAQEPAPYRVLSDGSLDTGFRANAEAALTGVMVTPLAIVEDVVGQAATTGGKKYVVGKHMPDGWEVNLARLNADGTLDSSFATTQLWTSAGDPGQARIVVTSAGIYVVRVAEEVETDGVVIPSQAEVLRVLATGGLDSAFNGGVPLGPTLSTAVIPFGVAVDGHGILSAFGAHNSPAAGVVARFDATGAPISTFATLGELTIAGLATNGADLPDFCIGLADGRMLVGTQVLTDVVADDDFNASKRVLRRYTVAGALDPTFGSGGQLVTATDANQRASSFEVMLNQATGGVDGFLYDHFPAVYGSGLKDGIVWYNADGQVAFGADGLITFPLDYMLDEMGLVQSDGKLLVWGQYGSGTKIGAVARITASGAFDSGFAGTGYASYAQVTDVTDMVRCQDGTYRLSGLLMSGVYPDQVAEARVVKLNADGSVDTGFGSGGVLVAGSGSANDPWHMASVHWEDTGAFHYVVRGPATGAVTIGRMLASGLPDGTFGSGGMASHDLAIGTLPWQIDEFVRTSDGKLMMTYAVDQGDRLMRNKVVRFTATGAIDTTYGTAGFIDLGTTRIPPPTPGASNRALKTDFWTDGTLRVMPEIWEQSSLLRPGESLGGLRCFDAAGQPDASIAAGGVLTVPGMTRVAYAWQSAGVLSVVGANDTPDLMVARFLIGPAAPAITSSTVASGTVGLAFSYTITASNTPTSYDASGLPAGLSVDTGTGLISGTPSTSGSFPVTISATNANGIGSTTLTITVNAALPVATMALGPNPVIGGSTGAFIVNLSSSTATDLTLPLIISGTAAGGVDVSPLSTSVVVLSGSSVGNILVTALGGATPGRTITITIDAGAGFTVGAPASGTLTIQPAAPAITSPATAAAIKGSAFTYSITATSAPTSYGASGLPAGLSVDIATGQISGTPTVTGTFPVTISASNASGTGNAVVSVLVAGAAWKDQLDLARLRFGSQVPNGTGWFYQEIIPEAGKTVSQVVWTTSSGYVHTQPVVNHGAWAYDSNLPPIGSWVGSLPSIEALFPAGTCTAAITNTDLSTETLTCVKAAGSYPDFLDVTAPLDQSTGVSLTPTISWTGTVAHPGGAVGVEIMGADAAGNLNGTFHHGVWVNSVSSYTVPGGLLNANTSYVISVRNANGDDTRLQSDTWIRITTLGPPVVGSATTAFAAVGSAFSYQITASNTPTSFGASGLPAGLSINVSTGEISGIPTVSGNFPVTVSATNGLGTGTLNLTLSVSAAAPVITSVLAAAGTETAPFSYQIIATNSPSSYGASGLPSGLSVDTASGLISGTPITNGVSNVTITATNATGTGSDTLVITVAPPTPVTVTVADKTVAYDGTSHTLVATASNPAATFSFGYELLDPDRVTYQASATTAPTAGGTYRVTATAGGGYSGSGTGTLVIQPRPPVVSGPTVTASTTPTWSWTPAGGGTGQYRFKLDDSDLSTGATTTASVSFTAGSALVDGPHLVYVQEQNQSGDWSASGAATVVVDSLGTYSLPIITPPGGDFTGSVTVTLGTAVSVGGLSLHYTLDGSDPAISPTALTYGGPMVFKAGERLRVVARNGASTSPESTATLRVVGDPTQDVLPPELWSVSSPSVELGNTLSVKVIHGTPPYSVAVSGASYFTPEAMANTYDFKKDGVACAGVWVDVVADRIGTITVTVTDSLARSLSATASAVAGGSVAASPAAVTPSTSTVVNWTALSPQTMAGVERLLAVAGSTDRTQFRGLWYDAPGRTWRDLPEKPVGGQLPMSGFYVASRQPVDLAGTGAPVNSYSQIGKIYPGWNLVGVPAVVNYGGTLVSDIPASALMLLDEDGAEVPAGYPRGMLRIARWLGGSFQHLVGGSSGIDELSAMTGSLVCGASYCIYNGTTTPARPLYLMVDPGVLPVGSPRAAGRTLVDKRVGLGGKVVAAPATIATSVNSYASRYGGEPAAPPGAGSSGTGGVAGLPGGLPAGSANGSPVALPAMSGGGSGGGGCGLGSGLGLVALGGALALAGRLRRRR